MALSWDAPEEDADAVEGYEILRRRPNRDEDTPQTLVANTGSTGTGYTDATATEAGARYTDRVKAVRDGERSPWSNYATVLLPEPEPTPTPTPTPEPTPKPATDPADLAPSGLTAEVVDDGVALTWEAPAEGPASVIGYEILRTQGEGELTTLTSDTGSTATTYTDTTATETGATYTYAVKAIRGEEWRQASDQVQVQIPHDPADWASTGLTAEVVDGGGAALSWTAPAKNATDVTGYEILRAVGGGEFATLVSDTESTGTAYTDTTASTADETYAYKPESTSKWIRAYRR